MNVMIINRTEGSGGNFECVIAGAKALTALIFINFIIKLQNNADANDENILTVINLFIFKRPPDIAIICINTQIPPNEIRDEITGSIPISLIGSIIILLISKIHDIIEETLYISIPVKPAAASDIRFIAPDTFII